MTSGTLVMLHGMTGTTEKMQPLAKRLAPHGWNVLCPQAIIEHPTRVDLLGGYVLKTQLYHWTQNLKCKSKSRCRG